MTLRVAACHCGQLTLTCEGEPLFVAICHCRDCQRRTGSSYNLGAWFERSRVAIVGREKCFRRTGDGGMDLTYHFCPECGANVYWEASTMETSVGVAGGAFADTGFPTPTVSLYDKRRHQWVRVPEGVPCHIAGLDSAKV